MIRIFTAVILSMTMAVTFLSCNSPDKPGLSNESPIGFVYPPVEIPAKNPVNAPGGDPSFIVMQDTVSLFGPHSITRNVLQDKNGNIWLATWEGIVLYDGEFFTNITLKEGLRQFHVMSVLEDKKGNLWFGTIGGGVYRYNPTYASVRTQGQPLHTDGNFTLFTTTDGLVDDAVLCMLEDKAGNIWFGTKAGISCYDPSALLRKGSRTFTNFTTKEGLSDNFVSTMAEDKNGKLWFGTNGGVCCCVPSGSIFSDSKSLPAGQAAFSNFNISKDSSFHLVRSIMEDKTGNIWIGCAEGLYRHDPSALPGNAKALTKVTTNGVYYIFEASNGNLWLSGGELNSPDMILYRYDPRQANAAGRDNSLTKVASDKQVFGIIQDRNGNIWYGTANGVCRYNPSQGKSASITRFTVQVAN